MGISLQQYRASIGLHNVLKSKSSGHNMPSGSILSNFDFLFRLVSAAGLCIKYILRFVWILIFVIKVCHREKRYHTASPNVLHENVIYSSPVYHNYYYRDNSRIILSCFLYCIIQMLYTINSKIFSEFGPKKAIKYIFFRLFQSKGFCGCLINIYTMWLFTINFLLLILTIPNIVNPGPINELNIMFQNVQGFINLRAKSASPALFTTKVLNFQGYIFNEKPDVVILNESWLTGCINDSEIFPNNSYKIFRRDRSLKSHPFDETNPKKYRKGGGGVALAFRSDLDVSTTLFKVKGKMAKAEILSVVVTSRTGKKICFSTLYRVGNLGAENLAEVRRHLHSISASKSYLKHILVGDINLNKTSWPEGTSTCENEVGYLNIFKDFGFKQLISEPTHIAGKTLDLLLCNCPELVSDVKVLPKDLICSSDHHGIIFKVKLNHKRLKSQKRKIFNFKKADFKSINNELMRIKWDAFLYSCEINTALTHFESIFNSLCDKYIPKVTIKSNFQPPWFDSELDNLCKRKNRLLNKFKKTKDPKIYEEVKKLRKKFKITCEKKKRDNVINDDDPAIVKKKFWSYYKSTSNSNRIPETERLTTKVSIDLPKKI